MTNSYKYTVVNSSPVSGLNTTVTVHHMDNNLPVFVGKDDRLNTAAWRGGRTEACRIISKHTSLELDRTGYTMADKRIFVSEV